ncbi:MAG: methyltransferase domain-containing protein [Candidatus Altiarchaeota archaeon]
MGYYSLPRAYINEKISDLIKNLEYPTLNIGAGKNTATYGTIIKNQYICIDICKNSKPDIVGDAHTLPFRDETFNSVICTEVLEHVEDPKKVVDEIYRVLKFNGICIVSVPFLYPIHPCSHDYWRFTEDSLKLLFRNFKGVKVEAHGGRLAVVWNLIARGILRVLQRFNAIIKKLDRPSNEYVLGYIVYAKK